MPTKVRVKAEYKCHLFLFLLPTTEFLITLQRKVKRGDWFTSYLDQFPGASSTLALFILFVYASPQLSPTLIPRLVLFSICEDELREIVDLIYLLPRSFQTRF